MAENSLMSLLFGKKRRRRRRKTTTKKSIKNKRPKGLTATVRKQAKRHRVRIRLKSGKYRKLSLIKKEIRKKRKAKLKRAKAKARKRPVRRRRRRTRRSSFGVGGSYMPLSSFMSPYPYSVDSSPPWL